MSGAQLDTQDQASSVPKATPSALETSAISDRTNESEAALQNRDGNDQSWETRRESKAGNAGGDEHGKEKGTGEHWVKTTGLAADGGNFDATKPGAGKEADRRISLSKIRNILERADSVSGLLEQKGVHKSESGQASTQPAVTSLKDSKDSGDKGKVSLSEKIKNKLHIGHKDKDKK